MYICHLLNLINHRSQLQGFQVWYSDWLVYKCQSKVSTLESANFESCTVHVLWPWIPVGYRKKKGERWTRELKYMFRESQVLKRMLRDASKVKCLDNTDFMLCTVLHVPLNLHAVDLMMCLFTYEKFLDWSVGDLCRSKTLTLEWFWPWREGHKLQLVLYRW